MRLKPQLRHELGILSTLRIPLGILAFLTRLAYSADDFATAKQVRGVVELQADASSRATLQVLHAGDKIPLGYAVTTAPNALLIFTLPDASLVKVNPNSQVRVESAGKQNTLELLRGGVFSQVQKHDAQEAGSKPTNHFRIKTKAAVMGVRGTEFFTSLEETSPSDPSVWMCVREGEVEVQKSKGEAVTVHAGEGIRVTLTDPLPHPRAFEWTKNLNWNMDPEQGDLFDHTELPKNYKKLIDQDYD